VRTVQLRIKHASHEQLQAQVRQSIQAAQAVGAQLFINDHWQMALQEGAYGVHLGQEDLETANLPLLAQSGIRLGLSTHSMWEVCRALAWQPSYIACGPVHATQSKDMPWLPQGNGNVAYWSQVLQPPVVAIAGMNVERVHQAAWHGAAGVALISAITAAPHPEQTIAQLIQAEHDGRLANTTQPIAAPAWPQPTLQQLAAPCCD
jgi:hydroxymethylpyrimidine kinase / phosphomethylpyrimidine kinase / thiamine-phosphate diphosphorylase